MDRKMLLRETQTSQVKLLTMKLLSDGQEHSRKEIIDFLEEQREIYGLPEFHLGHINGGIRQAIQTLQCVTVRPGVYKATVEIRNDNVSTQLRDCNYQHYHEISEIIRKIDIVNATDTEMRLVALTREYLQVLKEWKEKFNNIE